MRAHSVGLLFVAAPLCLTAAAGSTRLRHNNIAPISEPAEVPELIDLGQRTFLSATASKYDCETSQDNLKEHLEEILRHNADELHKQQEKCVNDKQLIMDEINRLTDENNDMLNAASTCAQDPLTCEWFGSVGHDAYETASKAASQAKMAAYNSAAKHASDAADAVNQIKPIAMSDKANYEAAKALLKTKREELAAGRQEYFCEPPPDVDSEDKCKLKQATAAANAEAARIAEEAATAAATSIKKFEGTKTTMKEACAASQSEAHGIADADSDAVAEIERLVADLSACKESHSDDPTFLQTSEKTSSKCAAAQAALKSRAPTSFLQVHYDPMSFDGGVATWKSAISDAKNKIDAQFQKCEAEADGVFGRAKLAAEKAAGDAKTGAEAAATLKISNLRAEFEGIVKNLEDAATSAESALADPKTKYLGSDNNGDGISSTGSKFQLIAAEVAKEAADKEKVSVEARADSSFDSAMMSAADALKGAYEDHKTSLADAFAINKGVQDTAMTEKTTECSDMVADLGTERAKVGDILTKVQALTT